LSSVSTQSEQTITAFLIAGVEVTDNDWVPAYAPAVRNVAARHGGKYLTRSGNIETIKGEGLDKMLVALIQFPDRSSLEPFIAKPDDAPYAKAFQDGSVSRVQVIDDTDLAGAISCQSKG